MSRMSDADTDRDLPPAAYEEPAAFDPADAHAAAGAYPPCVQCGNTAYISRAGVVQCDKCGKPASDAVPPHAAQPPRYEIATLADFVKVPQDRLCDCLAEFAAFVELIGDIEAMLQDASKATRINIALKPSVFTWIDDGRYDSTITFIPPNGETTCQNS